MAIRTNTKWHWRSAGCGAESPFATWGLGRSGAEKAHKDRVIGRPDPNLHAIWDRDLVEKMIEREGGVGAFVNHAARAQEPPSVSINDWARESWGVARGLAYHALPAAVGCGALPSSPEQIGVAYERSAEPVVRSRLTLAGVRLAAILNNALGDGSVVAGEGGR